MYRFVRIVVYIALILAFLLAYKTNYFGEKVDQYVMKRALFISQAKTREWANTFLGVPMPQYSEDLLAYSEIIYKTKPDVILETGTFAGGSAYYFATILRNVNPAGKVITIDITDEHWNRTLAAKTIPEDILPFIHFIQGDSTDPQVQKEVRDLVEGKNIFVFLDASHEKKDVLNELRSYGPLVQKNGYCIVSDTTHDLTNSFWEGRGPLAALQEYLKEVSFFAVDPQYPKSFISASPGGFLRRVR